MTWFVVKVEDANGIQGDHYVQALWPSSAREAEEEKGFVVLSIREWKKSSRFPNITRA